MLRRQGTKGGLRTRPNLLIIGAAKCGTTSLHHYLTAHPQVYMSRPKELNFWQDPECLKRLPEYERAFSPDAARRAAIRGEATPLYTYHPLFTGTAERIHAVLPDVRLIYVVREPVERTISHYVQDESQGFPLHRAYPYYRDSLSGRRDRTFDAVFSDLGDPLNPYVAVSRYGTQLARYLDLFPSGNVLVLDSDDLLRQRDATMARVFEFLGLEPVRSQQFATILNAREEKLRPRRPSFVPITDAATHAVRPLPKPARRLLRSVATGLLFERMRTPTVSDALRACLRSLLDPEVDLLEQLTGMSFGHWRLADHASPAR